MTGWRGYIFSREIGGSIIPHRVQNLVIRDYAAKHGLEYLLSAVEYRMKGSFMMLKALIEERDTLDGVILYNTHLLPLDKQLRTRFFQTFLTKNKDIRFALEDLEISQEKDIEIIEDIILTRKLTNASPSNLKASMIRDRIEG